MKDYSEMSREELIAELESLQIADPPARNGMDCAGAVPLVFSQEQLDLLPTPIFYKSRDGIYLGCNKFFEEFLGLERCRIVGSTVYDIAPAEFAQQYEDMDQQLLRDGGEQVYESRVKAKDGEIRRVRFHKAVFHDESGCVAGLVGQIFDVTEQRKVQDDLRRSQDLYLRTLEALDGKLSVIDRDLRVVLSNWKDHEYVPEEERASKPHCYSAFKGLKTPCDNCISLGVFSDGQPRTVEDVNPYDNSFKLVTAVPLFDDEGEVINVVEYVRDITRQKQAQQVLENEKHFLDDILNAIPIPIMVKNVDGTYTACNAAFATLIGKPMDEAIGSRSSDLFSSEYVEEFNARDAQALASGHSVTFETGIMDPDANWRILDVIKTPFKRVDDESWGILTVVLDLTERKERERELVNLQTLLDRAQAMGGVGSAEVDPLRDTALWSANQYRLFGYEPQEIDNPHAFFLNEIVDRADRDAVRGLFALPFSMGNARNIEYRARRKDGQELVLHGMTMPQFNEAGALGHIHWFTQDITERKQAEQALRRSEEQYRLLAENMTDAVCVYDRNLNILYASPSVSSLGGYKPEELISRSVAYCLNPGSFVEMKQAVEKCMRDVEDGLAVRGHTRLDLQVNRKDGREIWVEAVISTMAGTDGIVSGVIVVCRDVTKRREIQDALEESERRFRHIFELTPVSLWEEDCSEIKNLVDRIREQGIDDIRGYLLGNRELVMGIVARTSVVDINPAGLELFEMDDRDSELASLGQVFTESSFIPFVEGVDRLARDGRSVQLVNMMKTLKGRPITCRVSVVVMPGFEETWERVVVSMVDITELLEMRHKAERADKAKSMFLANMSHDLRTPINGIMGMLQILRSEPLESELHGYVEMGIDACKRLSGLLSDILDLSRIEAGRMPLDLKPFKVVDMASGVGEMFSLAAQERGVRLKVICDPALPAVLVGDENRIFQVMTNVVGNAVKFSRKSDVVVEIFATHAFADHVILLISVADSGVGIPMRDIASLFDMFTQASTTEVRMGSGLGLAIVKRLVTQMSGGVCVESEEGVGTTFYIHLPLALPDDHAETSQEGAAGKTRDSKTQFRALVVEDDEMSMMVLATMLRKMGAVIVEANNGEEALVRMREESFDMIFMDVQLPGMDGVEVVKRLRNAGDFACAPNTPVVALTAYAMEGDRERFLASGMDAYISKPVDISLLTMAVQKYVGTIGS